MLKDHFSKWSEMKSLSRVQVFTTPWTVAYQSTEFSRARILEWVAIFFSRDLPDPGIKPGSPSLQADAFTVWATREAKCSINGPQILVSLDGNGNVDQVYLTW